MLKVEYAGQSEQGPVRENNEDFISFCSPDDLTSLEHKGCFFVIADGVGGQRAGEVASQEAAQFLLKRYYTTAHKPLRALKEAFSETNLHICNLGQSKPEYRRMETTLSALCLVGQQVYISHVGDTRIYRVRGGEIKQLTTDHSEVGELLRMRLITAEEARHHPRRNVITRSVGSELLLRSEFISEPLQAGDAFVLCTDGLWEPVEDGEIAAIVGGFSSEAACQRLVELALERGTADNLSIQVVKVLQLGQKSAEDDGSQKGLLKRALRFLGTSG